MAAPLSMEGFRSLERHEQVLALADAEFLGMAVTKHYAAQDYNGITTDGVDFTLTFREGRGLSWLRKADQEE